MKISHIALAVLFALPVAVVSTNASQDMQAPQTSGWRKPVILDSPAEAGADTPAPEVVPPAPNSCSKIPVQNQQGTTVCTLDLTFTVIPVDDGSPCGADDPLIHITGTITCGQSSCPVSFYRCGSSTSGFQRLCGGHNIHIVPGGSSWGGYASGQTGCSTLQVFAN